MIAYHGHILFTKTSESFEVLPHGYVVVDDRGVVAGVYSQHEWQARAEIEVVELGNRLLIPGMNDMHVHAPQLANMGIAMDMPLLPWLEQYTFPEESKFADIAYAKHMYKRFVKELVKHGTMRAAIFATIHPEATECLADQCNEAGIGAYIGLVGMDRNCPEMLRNTVDEVVAGTERLSAHVAHYPLVKAIVTPRFVPSCSSDMLRAMGAQAAKEELMIQSHLCETPNEIRWVKELEPTAASYSDVYHSYGLMNDRTLMAHCVYPSERDIELLRQTGAMVVHCPSSNCNLGSGIAPVRQLLEKGIDVALGTDIAAGHDLSILHTMHYAIQMSKLVYAESGREVASLTLPEVFYMATKGGGRMFGQVGSFELGYDFDALVIDDAEMINGQACSEEELYLRLERFIYVGNDRQIVKRFCKGKEIIVED